MYYTYTTNIFYVWNYGIHYTKQYIICTQYIILFIYYVHTLQILAQRGFDQCPEWSNIDIYGMWYICIYIFISCYTSYVQYTLYIHYPPYIRHKLYYNLTLYYVYGISIYTHIILLYYTIYVYAEFMVLDLKLSGTASFISIIYLIGTWLHIYMYNIHIV